MFQTFTTIVSGNLEDFPLDSGNDDNTTDNDVSKPDDDMSMSNLDMDDEPSNDSS